MQKPEWLPQVSIRENFFHHYALGFLTSYDEYCPPTPPGTPSSFCALSVSGYLQSIAEREGRRWTWKKGKAKVYSPAPPAGCCGGFLPAFARWSSPSSSLPGVQDRPPLLPFQMEGWRHFYSHQPEGLHWPLLCPSTPNSLFTTLLDCLNESSVSCQDSDIQEF